MKMVIDEELRLKELEKSLDLVTDMESTVETVSSDTDEMYSEDDNLLLHFLDVTIPKKMEIPSEILSILCPTKATRGVESFDQVIPEPKLCEQVLAVDRALTILSDFGKVFFEPKWRFEFCKVIAQWKLLVDEKMRSTVEDYFEVANALFQAFSQENQENFANFMKR